jgi:endonuclease/exonuclease/phosphatase family metal-dependent hydrolase
MEDLPMSRRTPRTLALLASLCTVVLALTACNSAAPEPSSSGPAAAGAPGKYLFCSWNVENLFDDKDDGRKGPGDREYDPLFANNPELLRLKLSKLSEALVKMNGGRGPDILAVVEVESVRAAELLQKALNDRLERGLHYKNVLMKEVAGGRHIAPAILTRLPVDRGRTKLLGKRQRILQGVVTVNGHDLYVIASHWASRLEKGSEKRRASYAEAIYGRVRELYTANPRVDVIVCGDFNDTPSDDSVVKSLHATGDRQAVRKSGAEPKLLNLFARKDADEGFGTHYYRRWFIFDQIIVSPGMLDARGWSCDPDTARTVQNLTADKHGHPWRFGGEDTKSRGYSDHFPVTVQLQVAP